MNIYFDSTLRTRSGRRVPYWDITRTDAKIRDGELRWFHEGYGRMKLYRLWKVDEENFIADSTGVWSHTHDPNWELYSKDPELALQEN